MLTEKLLLCFFALGLSSSVFSDGFHIEDPELSLVPEEISALIKVSENAVFDECTIVGVKVDLDGDGQFGDILATTKDACAWGRATGPIWGLRGQQSGFSIILSGSGGSLKITDSFSNGLKDLRSDSGSAGLATVNLYKFNGSNYIQKRYFFSADDVDECIKHKDICPFKVD